MTVSTKQQQIAQRTGSSRGVVMLTHRSAPLLERTLPLEEPDALTALVRVCGGAVTGNRPLYPIGAGSCANLAACSFARR